MITTVATAVTTAVLVGGRGLVAYAAVAVGVAFGVQLITYVQHWRLGADHPGERVAYGRGWEEDCRIQAWITMNISLRDGHHRDSRLPYYRLGMRPDSPRLPAIYVLLMFASLVPPLQFAMMRPAPAHLVPSPT